MAKTILLLTNYAIVLVGSRNDYACLCNWLFVCKKCWI